MNNVILIGRLVRDPEISYAKSELCVARFTLAIDRGGDNGADFPGVTCFGKTAELVEKYLSKGRQVAVVGRLQTGSYEKDGHKFYTTDVIADRVEFLGSKGESEPKQEQQAMPGFTQIAEEDIPF